MLQGLIASIPRGLLKMTLEEKGPSPEADPEVGEDHGGSQETEI